MLGKFKITLLIKSLYFITVLMLIQNCTSPKNEKISEWRGPNRTGIYEDKNLLSHWPVNGPKLLWVYNGIGNGYGSPSILGDKLIVNGEVDSNSIVSALNLKGELLWKSQNGKEFVGEGFSSTYPGARSTPTIVNDLVYVASGKGRIACLETSTGHEKWAVDIIKDLGGSENPFGYTESLIVNDSKVYSFVGGAKNNMVAFNGLNGKIEWTSEALKDTFSYCSPILVEFPTRKAIVTHSRRNLYAVDCKNGQPLGAYELTGYEWDGEHCNSPIYSDEFIYFIGNDEKGNGAIKLQLLNNGEQLKEIWINKKIHNNFNAFVKVDNNLFTTVKGNKLISLNTENGEIVDSLNVATGSLIFADNKLICYGMNGDVNLVIANDNRLTKAGTFKVDQGTGHHFSHPVLVNGILYIRHGNSILAYDLRDK